MELKDAAGLALGNNTRYDLTFVKRRNLRLGVLFVIILGIEIMLCIEFQVNSDYILYEPSVAIQLFFIIIWLLGALQCAILCFGPLFNIHISFQKEYFLFSTIFCYYIIINGMCLVSLFPAVTNEQAITSEYIATMLLLSGITMLIVIAFSTMKKFKMLKNGEYGVNTKLYKELETRELKKGMRFGGMSSVVVIFLSITFFDAVSSSLERSAFYSYYYIVAITFIYVYFAFLSYRFADNFLVAYCRFKFDDFNSSREALLGVDRRNKAIQQRMKLLSIEETEIRVISVVCIILLLTFFSIGIYKGDLTFTDPELWFLLLCIGIGFIIAIYKLLTTLIAEVMISTDERERRRKKIVKLSKGNKTFRIFCGVSCTLIASPYIISAFGAIINADILLLILLISLGVLFLLPGLYLFYTVRRSNKLFGNK